MAARSHQDTISAVSAQNTMINSAAENSSTSNQSSRLLNLPIEILTMILELVCAYPYNIDPQPLEELSKFQHVSLERLSEDNLSLVISALDLRQVCKGLRQFVDSQQLLYKLNTFQFFGCQEMLDYLKSLPLPSRNSVKRIRVVLDTEDSGSLAGLTVLRSMKNPKHLTLDISSMRLDDFANNSQWNGAQALRALRGLESLTLTYYEDSFGILYFWQAGQFRGSHFEQDVSRFEIAALEHGMGDIMKLPKLPSDNPTHIELANALDGSDAREDPRPLHNFSNVEIRECALFRQNEKELAAKNQWNPWFRRFIRLYNGRPGSISANQRAILSKEVLLRHTLGRMGWQEYRKKQAENGEATLSSESDIDDSE